MLVAFFVKSYAGAAAQTWFNGVCREGNTATVGEPAEHALATLATMLSGRAATVAVLP
jgi:hypothetical protein